MFNLANLFTSFNLVSGVLAIVLAITGHLFAATMCVFAGAFFDFLDGFVARLFKTTGELGKQLDSLADMVTFGVVPGVVMMVVMTVNIEDVQSSEFMLGESTDLIRGAFFSWVESFFDNSRKFDLLPLTALFIPFFSLFRLAKFNIDTRQTTSFIGLPTPANTLFFMTFPLVLTLGASSLETLGILFNPYVIVMLIFIMGFMMVSEIPLFSLKFSKLSFKGNEIRIVFLLISLILILLFQVWAIALIVFLYLILSVIENNFFNKGRNEI